MSEISELPTPPPPVATKKPKMGGRKGLRPRLGEIYLSDDDSDEAKSGADSGPVAEADEAAQQTVSKPPPTGEIKDAWKHLRRKNQFIIIGTWSTFIFVGLFLIFLGHFAPYQTSYLRGHVMKGPPPDLLPNDPAIDPHCLSKRAEPLFTVTDASMPMQTDASTSKSTINSATASTTAFVSASSASGQFLPQRSSKLVPVSFRA